ncbi:MAG: FG-GAP-like repeat-containing protein, partial [Planctomycetota bacterium]
MKGLRGWCVRVAIIAALPLVAACSGGGGTGDAPQDVPADALASATEGAAAMGQFDFAAAERAFAAAREKAPQWRTAQLDEAISILNQSVDGAQERALALLQLLASDPDLGVRAAYCMGLAHLFLGDPNAALPQFRRAAEAFPEDPHAAYYTGQSLELTGEWKAALPWYRRALELDPYLRSSALGVQRILAREGDAAGAEDALKLFDMLAQNPRSTLAEFKYSRMGRLGEIVLPDNAVVVPPRAGALFGPFVPLKVNNWPATHSPDGFLAAVDIDSDGWTDLLWVATIAQPAGNPARQRTRRIVVLRNVGGGEGADTSYDARVATDLDPLLGYRASQWGDLNNDGKIDVVCKSQSSGGVVLLVQDAAGVFAESKMDLGSVTLSLLNGLADLDHDGDLDIMSSEAVAPPPGQSGGRRYRPVILYNRLDAGWEVVPLPAQPSDYHWTLVAADIDADGDSDIIASSVRFQLATVEVLINDRLWKWTNGGSRFAPLTTTPLSECVAFERADDGVLLLAGLKHRGGTTRPDCDLQVWAFERSGVRLVRSTHYGM